MAKIIPYNPKLKPLARHLRKNMTFGEVLLWNELKEDKFYGFDFDRQRCIDEYIVDFYCKDIMLAIEVDGNYHNNEETSVKDAVREDKLKSLGVTIIRFTENEIKRDLQNVLVAIEAEIIKIIKRDNSVKLPADSTLTCWLSTS